MAKNIEREKKQLERKIKARENKIKETAAWATEKDKAGMQAELDEWRKELEALNNGETPTTNQRVAYEKRMEVEHPQPAQQTVEQPAKVAEPKGLTFNDVLAQTGDDPQKVRDWLAAHPDYKAGDITNKWLNEHPVEEKPVETGVAESTESSENEERDFKVGNKVDNETSEENKDLKKFWDNFRAGSLRAYPWLQTIGDAIGKNARMTQDRAAILTGGQRDVEAYNPVNPEEHITDDYRVEQAYADARAGNLDSIRKLIMSGDVTIENVAAALNMTEEEAKKVFGNYMVKDTAEARTAAAGAEQAEAQVETTYLQNATTVQNNINFIDEKIREIDTAISQLQSNDYDTYLKVYGEYINNVRGIENTGIASTATSNEGFGVDAKAGGKIGGIVNIGASGNFDKSWGSSNTSTGSTDVLARQAMPKAEYMAQAAMGERNAANNELIQKLEAQKAQLQQARDTWQQTLEAAQKKLGTKLNYKPRTQSAPTQSTETQGAQ